MEEKRRYPAAEEPTTPQEEPSCACEDTPAEDAQSEEKRTEEELKNAVFTKAGIAADRYEGELLTPKEEESGEFAPGTGVSVWYDFTKEEIQKALRLFQKHTLYKKNILYSAIVAALFVIQFSQLMMGTADKISYLICVVCIAVLAMIWYLPQSHIRQVQKAMDSYDTPPKFFMELYPGAVRTGTGDQAVLFRFDSHDLRAFETDDLFIVCYKNQSLFPIPKRCCAGLEEDIRSCLQTLGQQFVKVSG